jgi:hypothetical protein
VSSKLFGIGMLILYHMNFIFHPGLFSNSIKCFQKKRRKKGQKKKKKNQFGDWQTSSESESEDESDEDLLLLEEEESLKFSSPSETELELDSDGSEYAPTGRNAKRQEALKSK